VTINYSVFKELLNVTVGSCPSMSLIISIHKASVWRRAQRIVQFARTSQLCYLWKCCLQTIFDK